MPRHPRTPTRPGSRQCGITPPPDPADDRPLTRCTEPVAPYKYPKSTRRTSHLKGAHAAAAARKVPHEHREVDMARSGARKVTGALAHWRGRSDDGLRSAAHRGRLVRGAVRRRSALSYGWLHWARPRPAFLVPPNGSASPAARAPLGEVGSLGAERRVVAVAGVEPGLVGQPVEDLGLDVVDAAGAKAASSPKVLPTPPGKSESPVNRCGWPSGVVVQQGDRAGRVAGERRSPRACRCRPATVSPSPHRAGSTATPVCSVIASASGAPATTVGAGGGDDVGEGAVVVPVLVGGDHGGEPGVADQRQQRRRARRRRRRAPARRCRGSAAGSSCWTSSGRRPPW